jgi:outer membrane protein OmpA-like peptidoglycan-associated protein
MAQIIDEDKTNHPEPKRSKAWLIFGLGLVAAAGFGWQFLSSSGQSVGSLLSGGNVSDPSPTGRPLSSGKISTGGNSSDVTPPASAPTLASSEPSPPTVKEASGSLKMTDLSTPVPSATSPDAAATAALLEKKIAEKKAALASATGKAPQADAAASKTAKADTTTAVTSKITEPAAKTASKVAQAVVAPTETVQGSTPPLKMDKEFRSLLYAVFYRWASADMGPNAKATVAKLIPEAQKGVRIVLTGRTDSSGDPGLNKILADRRAAAIKNAFVNKGVSGSIIETNINTSGETKLNEGTVTPLLPSAGNSRARRVDIYIEAKDGSGGGMKR